MIDGYESKHCVKAGICELCKKKLEPYDSKWHHPDGRMVCARHWLWNGVDMPPSREWMHYTDG